MLDSYSSSRTNVNNSIKINAVTGNILKNYQKSFFKRFRLDSQLAKELFDEDMPHLSKQVYVSGDYNSLNSYNRDGYYKTEKRPVIITQMMMCGETDVIAEIMWQDDFNKMFE